METRFWNLGSHVEVTEVLLGSRTGQTYQQVSCECMGCNMWWIRWGLGSWVRISQKCLGGEAIFNSCCSMGVWGYTLIHKMSSRSGCSNLLLGVSALHSSLEVRSLEGFGQWLQLVHCTYLLSHVQVFLYVSVQKFGNTLD